MKKARNIVNKVSRHYSDCMSVDAATQRCRPGTPNPQVNAQQRNIALIEATGEEVTLFTRKIRGDDITNRVLGPVQTNYISALPLNWIFIFNGAENIPNLYDPVVHYSDHKHRHFSDNLSTVLSDPKYATLQQRIHNNDPQMARKEKIKAIIVAKRPAPSFCNYIYAGNRLQFSNLSVKLLTRLYSDNVIWEYTRGNGIWLPVPMIAAESTPGASTLQQSGRMVFDPSFFPNWQQDYVKGELGFWVRAKIDENTEGEASAFLLFTENFIQSIVVWDETQNPSLFPNDKCVTVTVNGTIFNRVYDIPQLDYSQQSFALFRRNDILENCPLTDNQHSPCGLNPFDTCESDPLEYINEIGNISLSDTIRLRELAFLYNQLSRFKPQGVADTVVLLFTRNMRLDGQTVAATYTNICPCTAYGKFQTFRNSHLPDDSACSACYGIEFLNGYERYINPEMTDGNILMSFPAAPFDMPLEEHGYGSTQELTTARMSYTPKIFVRDLVIRYDEFGVETGRYIVSTRTDSRGRRGVLLHQEMVLMLLDTDKPEYLIPVPTLPLVQTEEQILASLGFPSCPPPPVPCTVKYQEKGTAPCLPLRNPQTE